MNHKELINSISEKTNLPTQDVENILEDMILFFTDQLSEGNTIGLQGFGNFEIRKKEERVSVHPLTRIRMLIPPKLVVNFKQSGILKEKLKELPHE